MLLLLELPFNVTWVACEDSLVLSFVPLTWKNPLPAEADAAEAALYHSAVVQQKTLQKDNQELYVQYVRTLY